MIAAALLTLREGLEAALVVGIVLGYLRKIRRLDRQGYVWIGVAAAVVASLILAIGLQRTGAQLEGPAEEIFEGTTMLLAVGVLTYMIFWMRYQARFIRVALEREVQVAVSQGHNWALAGLSFVVVLREGVETVLFLTAAAFVAGGLETVWGSLLGLSIAITIGALLYATTVRLPVQRFFDVTSVLLLLFAAGLLAHGIHEFQEAGLLPFLVEEAWNTAHLLDESSFWGSVLKALFGYNANPSLLEVLGYLGYWVVVLSSVRWWIDRMALQLDRVQS
ncbi:MAG: FTR1 family protein [Chloroflexi bacterium]|nr:FTR1 family protein [Chloroflexota bacterium]